MVRWLKRCAMGDRYGRVAAWVVALAVLCSAVGRAGSVSEPGAAAFDAIATDALATQKAPGFAFAVVHDGKIVYRNGFGVADVAAATPVTPQTRFAVGSITKQFTAAAILLLAQRGTLKLDDSLATYLPSFPDARAITLRMLLDQTSGLHDYPLMTEHDWPYQGAITLDSLIDILRTDRPDFAPGARFAYSNTNYTLLSAVIAKASGEDEAAFLQQAFFDPLAMSGSGYGYLAQQKPDLAIAYRNDVPFSQPPISLDLFAGAGAMISTAPDLARWDIALLAGKVLDAASMHALWTSGRLQDGATIDDAMGFVPGVLAGHREVWHNGLAPGAGGYCLNAIFPDDNLAIVVLSNGFGFDGVPEQMVKRVLALYDPGVTKTMPIDVPTPAPGEQPAVTARAKAWFDALQHGSVDRSQLDAAFAARLTRCFSRRSKRGAPRGASAGGRSASTPTANFTDRCCSRRYCAWFEARCARTSP